MKLFFTSVFKFIYLWSLYLIENNEVSVHRDGGSGCNDGGNLKCSSRSITVNFDIETTQCIRYWISTSAGSVKTTKLHRCDCKWIVGVTVLCGFSCSSWCTICSFEYLKWSISYCLTGAWWCLDDPIILAASLCFFSSSSECSSKYSSCCSF